jgi:uncharacterized protein (DUF58 family)
MLFSSRPDGKMKVEFAGELIVNVTKAILKAGHAVGLMMFGNKLYSRLDPNIGLAVEHQIKSEIRNIKNYGGNFDFTTAMKMLLSLQNKRLVTIIISDFVNLPESWNRYIEILNQKHEVIGIMIRDFRDRFLPHSGQIVVEDPSTNEKIYVDALKYSKKYHDFVIADEHEIESKFKASKCELLKIQTNEDGFEKFVKFFKKRVVTNT